MKQVYQLIILCVSIGLQVAVASALFSRFDFWNINRSLIAGTFIVINLTVLVYLSLKLNRRKEGKLPEKEKTITSDGGIFPHFISSVFFLSIYILLTIFFAANSKIKISNEEKVTDYFESLNGNENSLTAFFSAMPKGGDLHHHFSGLIYAETYWKVLVRANGWINLANYQVDTPGAIKGKDWETCEQIEKRGELANIRLKLIQQWSVKDFNGALVSPDKHFFEAFNKFRPLDNLVREEGLLEIKQRAISENVSYIETMLSSIDTLIKLDNEQIIIDRMYFLAKSDANSLSPFFDSVYALYNNRNIFSAVEHYNRKLNLLHSRLRLDDSLFTMRYLTYANRTTGALQIFRKLQLAFEAANRDTLIVGVNFVAPEDHEISLRDYKLHMQMFNFFHKKYSSVKISMHAGELAPGLVKPEDLHTHIADAVNIGHANRIGHGVDIASEVNSETTLNYMSKNKIPVEINLTSNDFILKVDGNEHPLLLYVKHKVPIIISTDDAGILRTDLTNQFVLLAQRYPNLTYMDIKQFVRNSITYSFLSDTDKERLAGKLKLSFELFEKDIVATMENPNRE